MGSQSQCCSLSRFMSHYISIIFLHICVLDVFICIRFHLYFFHLYLYSSVIIPNADHCSDPGLFPICSTSRSLYLCSIALALYTTSLIPPDRSSFRHHESFNQRFTFNSTKCEEQIHDGKIHTSCNDQTPCITQCTT